MTPRLDALGLVVADLDTSLAFYRRIGVAVPEEVEGPHVEADLGGMRLMWDTEEVMLSMDPGWTRPVGGHVVALAVRCDGAAEVDELHAALVEAGARSHLDPYDAPWGQRYASVLDPDGNPVDLYAPVG